MDETNKEIPEEEQVGDTPESDDIFKNMSEIQPLRDDNGDDDNLEKESDEHGTLEERIEGSRKLTDFQTLTSVLNPNFEYSHLNVLTKGRIFPDIYNPMFRVQLKHLIKTTGKSVAECIALVNTALSIAIDGEGRIDNIVSYTKGAQNIVNEQNKSGIV